MVEEAVDQRVDGVVDEERLDAELVGQLSQRTEAGLQVLDDTPHHHDDEVRQEAEDVGQGHGEQDSGGFTHADLTLRVVAVALVFAAAYAR